MSLSPSRTPSHFSLCVASIASNVFAERRLIQSLIHEINTAVLTSVCLLLSVCYSRHESCLIMFFIWKEKSLQSLLQHQSFYSRDFTVDSNFVMDEVRDDREGQIFSSSFWLSKQGKCHIVLWEQEIMLMLSDTGNSDVLYNDTRVFITRITEILVFLSH